jgi:hypothetical protein
VIVVLRVPGPVDPQFNAINLHHPTLFGRKVALLDAFLHTDQKGSEGCAHRQKYRLVLNALRKNSTTYLLWASRIPSFYLQPNLDGGGILYMYSHMTFSETLSTYI